jgi:hypothetical protein
MPGHFDETDRGRIARAVRRVEQLPPVRPRPPGMIESGGGSGGNGTFAKILRNPSYVPGVVPPYAQDPMGSPSPECYYFGQIESAWDPVTGRTFTEEVWVIFVYNQGAVTDTIPPTPVKTDGSAIHEVRYTGKSYNPGSYGTRRVFECTEAANGWTVGCTPSGPVLTLYG